MKLRPLLLDAQSKPLLQGNDYCGFYMRTVPTVPVVDRKALLLDSKSLWIARHYDSYRSHPIPPQARATLILPTRAGQWAELAAEGPVLFVCDAEDPRKVKERRRAALARLRPPVPSPPPSQRSKHFIDGLRRRPVG